MNDSPERTWQIAERSAPIIAELRLELDQLRRSFRLPKSDSSPESLEECAQQRVREAELLKGAAKALREVAADIDFDISVKEINAALDRATPEQARAFLAAIGEAV